MQRLFNIAFLAVIALSIATQTIGFALVISGESSPALAKVQEWLGVAVPLGTLIAAVKFLLHIVRSVRDPSARLLAASYGVIALWPLLLGLVVTLTGVDAMTVARPGGGRELSLPTAGAAEPYQEGRAWAEAHNALYRRDCKGTREFVRGCLEWIAGQREVQARAGSIWAREHRPARASQCEGTPDFALGCRTYYFQQLAPPKQPGQGPFGATTAAECIVEVNAHYQLAQELDLIEGKERAAQAVRERDWEPDLRACESLRR